MMPPPRRRPLGRRATDQQVINHYKMAKHFTLTITEDTFTFTRNQDAITA